MTLTPEEVEKRICEECPRAASSYSLSGYHLYCTVPEKMRHKFCPHVSHRFKIREDNCRYGYTIGMEFISKEEMTI